MAPLPNIVGDSAALERVRQRVRRLLEQSAARSPTLLIRGETGTGKGLLARSLHAESGRRSAPFVDISCSAIPETLLEAELFGFVKGAFTGAQQAKTGLLRAAHGGTVFLDEISSLSLGVQAKLLKVIDDRVVRPLGSTRDERLDVWIMSATNDDLGAAIAAGSFRSDLYHRLTTVTLELPPLRERGDDVLQLADHFLARTCSDYQIPPKTLDAGARAALQAYGWPGNIRELANVIERAVLLADTEHIERGVLGLASPSEAPAVLAAGSPRALRRAVHEFEHDRLVRTLQNTRWNVAHAAEQLGIPRATLRYRMARHGLAAEPSPPRRRREQPVSATRPGGPGPPSSANPGAAEARWETRDVVMLGLSIFSAAMSDPASIDRVLEIAASKVESFGGRLQDVAPTGVTAAFGVEPLEDASRRAALAATTILREVERTLTQPDDGVGLAAAVHSSPMAVAETDGVCHLGVDAKHSAMGILRSLLAGASRGEVRASAPAADALERDFEVSSPSDQDAVAGVPYRRVGRRLAPFSRHSRRRITPFVGRQRELRFLLDHVEQPGSVVGVIGEPGVGKSRLLHELRQSVTAQSVVWLEGRCLSHATGVPYVPIVDLVRAALGLDEAAPHDTFLTRAREMARRNALPDGADAYLLRLLGIAEGTGVLSELSPEAVKERTAEIVRRLLLGGERPTVLAVEDLHWVDPTSADLLHSVVTSATRQPVAFVSTYRAGYRPPWVDRSHVSQLALPSLAIDEGRRIVRSIVSPDVAPDDLAERIAARGQGNPFFLEELAWGLAHGGAEGLAVPLTVRSALGARMDGLPVRPRLLLESAAVLGREVPVDVLTALVDEPYEKLQEPLSELVRREFLREAVGGPRRVLVFKHALTQEVAYARLAPPALSALHRAAGDALEMVYAGRHDEVLDALAHHYARAGETAKAVEYLTRFGDKAAAGYALTEAVAAFEEALAQAERLPEGGEREVRVLGLVVRLGLPLMFVGRLADGRDLLLRHRERMDRLQNPVLAGPFYFLLAGCHDHLGEREQAMACVQRSIEEATRCGDNTTLGRALVAVSHGNLWAGEFRAGVQNAQRAGAYCRGSHDRLWLGMASWILALNAVLLGEFDQALEAARHAHEAGESIGDRRLQSYGHCITGLVSVLRGDVTSAIAAGDRALACAPDPLCRAVVLSFVGETYMASDPMQAIALLEEGLEALQHFHFPQVECWTLCRLSEAIRLTGQELRARDLAEKGRRLAETLTYPYGLGLAQRALGRIAASGADHDRTVAALADASAEFERIEARYDAALTHLDLARARHARGQLAAAGAHLDNATSLFVALHISHGAERCARLAREIGLSPDASASKAAPAGDR